MDNIEVELEEVKGLSKENQRLLEKLSRSMERDTDKTIKSAIKETISTMSGGSSGILDQAIKSLTGGSKLGGALAAGGAAGLTAAAVMELVNVMKTMVTQSKIASTIQNTIGSALGLLLDLVLLPFLPLLVWGILNLYNVILTVGNLWRDWMKGTPKLPDVFDPNKSALDKTVDVVSWINELARSWTEMMKGLILNIALAVGEIGATIIKFLWDIGYEIGTILFEAAKQAGADYMAWFTTSWSNLTSGLSNAWNDAMLGLEEFKNLVLGFFTFDWLKGWIDAFWSGFKAIGDAIGTIPALLDQAIAAIISGAKAIANAFIGGINAVLDSGRSIFGGLVPANLPYLDTGGLIEKTGVAVVHKGETVTPAGQSGNTYTLNFYGLTNEQLPTKIREVLRQDGARYQT